MLCETDLDTFQNSVNAQTAFASGAKVCVNKMYGIIFRINELNSA